MSTAADAKPLDVAAIRREFPILERRIGEHPLVYLDSAATNHRPRRVIDAVTAFYESHNSNVHRGVHRLSQEATEAYEATREKARALLGAGHSRELIWVRGTTEGINLVAQAYGRPRLGPGDEIVITHLEHHSNIVPWQLLCEQTGARLRVAPIDDAGVVIPEAYQALLGEKTRIVAFAHVSNALGTILPVKDMVARAHAVGAVTVVDGAQAPSHMKVDVVDLDCDFYTISAHKMYGPTGVGFLYGKAALLEEMPPWMGGGDMIASVSFEGTTFAAIPHKFEAGTPNIAGGIGFGAALDFLVEHGVERIGAWEHDLLAYGTEALSRVEGLRIVGTAPEKSGILSFVLDGIHPHDIGTILDHEGIAVRTGHHCAQPVMDRFGVPATARASLAVYNTRGDLDALAAGLREVRSMFA